MFTEHSDCVQDLTLPPKNAVIPAESPSGGGGCPTPAAMKMTDQF